MSQTNSNPLRENFGLPHFDQIKPEHVKHAVEEMLQQARRNFNQVERDNKADWESLILPLNETVGFQKRRRDLLFGPEPNIV